MMESMAHVQQAGVETEVVADKRRRDHCACGQPELSHVDSGAEKSIAVVGHGAEVPRLDGCKNDTRVKASLRPAWEPPLPEDLEHHPTAATCWQGLHWDEIRVRESCADHVT